MEKIVIYNDLSNELTEEEIVSAVLKLMQEETELIYGGPYIIDDKYVVSVIQNKKSTTFRVTRCIRCRKEN